LHELIYLADSAKVVESLCQSSLADTRITYFFCRFDDKESLQSTHISRALIRQCLDVENFPTAAESQLSDLIETGFSDAHTLEMLLQTLVNRSRLHFFIIDGLDECPKADRGQLMKMLKSTISHCTSLVKVFFASRDSIEAEIKQQFKSAHHVRTSAKLSSKDMKIYLNGALEQKIEDGELILGDLDLREEIHISLSQGWQGM
jgi:hypothetical protein